MRDARIVNIHNFSYTIMYNVFKGVMKMEFGDKLLLILNEKEITQKDFATLLNIAPTTLNGYIKNKRQPDFALLKRIAFSLNVSIDYLLDFNNSNLDMNIAELTLLDKLRKMDSKEQEIIYDLVNLIDKRRE